MIDFPCIVQKGTIKSIRQWLLANPKVLDVDHRGSHVNIHGSTMNQDALLLLKFNLIDTLRTLVQVEMQGKVLEEQSQIWLSRAPSTASIEFCKNVSAEFNPQGGDGEAPGEQVYTPYPKQAHARRSSKKIMLDFTTSTDCVPMNYAKAVQGNSTKAKDDGNSPKWSYTNPESDTKAVAAPLENKKQAEPQEGRVSENIPCDFEKARMQWKADQQEMEERFAAGHLSLRKHMLDLADRAEEEQEAQKIGPM